MFQQLILIGNLGNDPEMTYTPSGDARTYFSLAVNRRWTGRDGQRQEKTTWFNVTVWRKQAEVVSQYLSKGSKALVIGELSEARIYTNRDGNPAVSLDVTAHNVKFLSGRGDAAAGSSYGGDQAGAVPAATDSGGDTVSDEDIPF